MVSSEPMNQGIVVQQATKSNSKRMLGIWMFIMCGLISFMVVFGGYVRLTRSGLSMVNWHVVTGVIPPLSEADWIETFEEYKQSPEYQKSTYHNQMSLKEYKFIFYMEYLHRVLGRMIGLFLILPMAFFLVKGIIPKEETKIYLLIALTFGAQGFMGWCMVKSGLVDMPHVSHYRLTSHLMMALILLTMCFWVGVNNIFSGSLKRVSEIPAIFKFAIALIGVIILQIIYGGFVAGLKAGWVSNTFPLMNGQLVPEQLKFAGLGFMDDAFTVHFIHRWFAFAVLAFAGFVWYYAKKDGYALNIQNSAMIIVVTTAIQIILGIAVIYFHVPISLAIIHQGFALVVFLSALYLIHQLLLRREPQASPA